MKKKIKTTGKYFLDGLWIVLFLYFIARLTVDLLSYKETYQNKNIFEVLMLFFKNYFLGLLFGLFALLFVFQAGFLSYKIDQIRNKLGYSKKLKKSKAFLFFILKTFLFLPIPAMIIYSNNYNVFLILISKIIKNDFVSIFIIVLIIPFLIIFLVSYLIEKIFIPFFFKKKGKLV